MQRTLVRDCRGLETGVTTVSLGFRISPAQLCQNGKDHATAALNEPYRLNQPPPFVVDPFVIGGNHRALDQPASSIVRALYPFTSKTPLPRNSIHCCIHPISGPTPKDAAVGAKRQARTRFNRRSIRCGTQRICVWKSPGGHTWLTANNGKDHATAAENERHRSTNHRRSSCIRWLHTSAVSQID